MATSSPHRWYSFADFRLDLDRGALVRQGVEVKLRPKSFEVLCYLVERHGTLVAKDELLNAIWDDSIVTEGSLTQCVIDIRKALGDESREMIRTVPRRGYLFEVDVTTSGDIERTDVSAMSSIAVLPFLNLSNDDDTGFFAQGLTEEILDDLSRAQHYRGAHRPLKVASRTASFQFADGAEDISAVGDRLGVHYVLEGSVRRIANSLRVTAQLIRVADGFHLWSKSYGHRMSDGFEMQTRLARNIAHLAAAELGFDLWKIWASQGGGPFRGVDPRALHHYFDAEHQYLLLRLGEGGDWALYERLLRRAAEADPDFAEAHSILAFTYMKRLGGRLPLEEAATAAHASIDRAIALAPLNEQTLWQLGEIQLNLDLDYAGAEATFRKMLDSWPKNIWLHYNLAVIALREGRLKEALELLTTASALGAGHEQAGFLSSYAWLLNIVGDYERSLKVSAEGLSLASGGQERVTNLASRAHALLCLGRVEQAELLIEESWDLDGHLNPESYIFPLAKIGESERAARILNGATDESADKHALALGAFALGDVDGTFKAIETAIEAHDSLLVDSLRTAEWWDGIREDPRYGDMVDLLQSKETHTDRSVRGRACPLGSAS